MSRPPSTISPPVTRPGGSISRRIESASADLPEPDSPTIPSRSWRPQVEAHIAHRVHGPLAGLVDGAEVAHRERAAVGAGSDPSSVALIV